MGRLKRSCVVGSVVFHALTLALLVLAPVLLAKRVEKVQVIDLIPSEIVDQIMAPPAPVAPPTPPTPARFDTFLESLFEHFCRTVSRNLQKRSTKLTSKSLPSANTLALSASHSRGIYGFPLVGKVRELLFVQVVRGVVGRGRGSHGVVEGCGVRRLGSVSCGR